MITINAIKINGNIDNPWDRSALVLACPLMYIGWQNNNIIIIYHSSKTSKFITKQWLSYINSTQRRICPHTLAKAIYHNILLLPWRRQQHRWSLLLQSYHHHQYHRQYRLNVVHSHLEELAPSSQSQRRRCYVKKSSCSHRRRNSTAIHYYYLKDDNH